MRSVARGRDLSYLTDELQKRYGITRRRAALIARDQNNKATSVMQAARQQSLGITQGIWKHSHAGKEPRPSHVKADGKVFELSKGMYLDGKWVMPGEEINCRCTWSPVIPGLS
jgi:SPP1 gp7 family putative phage head morphogenesis protein